MLWAKLVDLWTAELDTNVTKLILKKKAFHRDGFLSILEKISRMRWKTKVFTVKNPYLVVIWNHIWVGLFVENENKKADPVRKSESYWWRIFHSIGSQPLFFLQKKWRKQKGKGKIEALRKYQNEWEHRLLFRKECSRPRRWGKIKGLQPQIERAARLHRCLHECNRGNERNFQRVTTFSDRIQQGAAPIKNPDMAFRDSHDRRTQIGHEHSAQGNKNGDRNPETVAAPVVSSSLHCVWPICVVFLRSSFPNGCLGTYK